MEAYILKNQEYLKVRNILKDWDDHDLPEANFVSISQLKCKRFPVRCNHRILPEEF